MSAERVFQRRASPNEQRTISREDLGFYYAVIVGGVYRIEDEAALRTPGVFYRALAQCIRQQPWLCVVVGDQHTDKSFFERVKSLNLENHAVFLPPSHDEPDDLAAIRQVLEDDVDKPFIDGCPPWRIIVKPLRDSSECFVAFSYSHTIGDGITGSIFHKTFFPALAASASQKTNEEQSTTTTTPPTVIDAPDVALPEAFDKPGRLTISWSFLLAPLLAVLIPKPIANLLGVKASASIADEGTWLAAPPFFDRDTHKTKVRVMEIAPPLLDRALAAARAHEAKLTGTIHMLITRALSQALPAGGNNGDDDKNPTNFVAQTAINMRRSIATPADEMGDFVSGAYVMGKRSMNRGPLTEEEWETAREATRKFASIAVNLHDQSIGLLRYAPSIRAWLLGSLGNQRDCSFEMSNIGVLDPSSSLTADEAASNTGVSLSKMVFTQPSHVAGPPVTFNFASVTGGSLVCTATWQKGALGIDGDEDEFIDQVCASLKSGFEIL